MMNTCARVAVFAIVLPTLFLGGCATTGEPKPVQDLLPMPGFADGWKADGEIKVFDKDTLSDHINGEAELYYPYGFKSVAALSYVHDGDANRSVTVDVYEMGSPLDGFGIYSSYRDEDSQLSALGAEGFCEDTQVMFYRGPYFVSLTAFGDAAQNRVDMKACAEAIAGMMPGKARIPEEVEMLADAGFVGGTLQYVAESMMGLDCFRKGFVAEAVMGADGQGDVARVFVVIEDTPESAKAALSSYLDYVKEEGGEADASASPIVANDPLYKGVLVDCVGRYIVGVAKLQDPVKGMGLWTRVRDCVK